MSRTHLRLALRRFEIIVEREVELYAEHRTDLLVQTLLPSGDKITVLTELKN
ncbi:hypothetical protein [Prosthecobacter sp.]|uniref:hypothetical protein n=1 Tax=Prosthecobacter sp. TaxID=1965333 RepID=UPI002488E82F|nr:hypothetical protein [Prosthecobacter sp.]MDI1312695.1 hypothetical protein [Prosthecobacter sp.]